MKLALTVVGAFVLSVVALVSVAGAGSPPAVVGNYTFDDLGQGGWGGGPLYADGTVGGGAAFSFGNGANVGSIQAVSWAPAGPGFVTMCFTDTATRGQLLFPSPFCVQLPVTGTPIKISEAPGEVSLLKVTLR